MVAEFGAVKMSDKALVPEANGLRALLVDTGDRSAVAAFDAAIGAGQKIQAIRIARAAGVLETLAPRDED